MIEPDKVPVGMKFHHPVHIGDEVPVYGTVTSVGRTLIAIAVEAWRRPRNGDDRDRVTQARYIFAAIDEDRRPRAVQPLDPCAEDAKPDRVAKTDKGIEHG